MCVCVLTAPYPASHFTVYFAGQSVATRGRLLWLLPRATVLEKCWQAKWQHSESKHLSSVARRWLLIGSTGFGRHSAQSLGSSLSEARSFLPQPLY